MSYLQWFTYDHHLSHITFVVITHFYIIIILMYFNYFVKGLGCNRIIHSSIERVIRRFIFSRIYVVLISVIKLFIIAYIIEFLSTKILFLIFKHQRQKKSIVSSLSSIWVLIMCEHFIIYSYNNNFFILVKQLVWKYKILICDKYQ